MPELAAVGGQAMDAAVSEQEAVLSVGRPHDVAGVLMCSLGVRLENDLAVVVDQGEADEHLVFAILVDVGDGRKMAGGTGPLPEHVALVRNAPHVPVAILDHKIITPAAAGQIGEEKTVVGRGWHGEGAFFLARSAVENHAWWRRPRSGWRVSLDPARVRRLGISGLADVEHLVAPVGVPVVDLDRKVAVDPAVLHARDLRSAKGLRRRGWWP